MEKTVLERTVDDYIESIKAKKKVADSTIKRKRQSLDYLVRVVGDIQPRSITETHMDKTFELMAKTRGENTLNVDLSNFRQFFKWCRRRKVTPASHDPVAEMEAWDLMPTERFILHVEEFPALLDAARTPRDRMVLALGLYLFLRASEICALKIAHVDRERGFIYTDIKKTKAKDKMPISEELDAELETWLVAYEQEVGVLKPDYYLVPSRDLDTSVYNHEDGGFVRADKAVERLQPTSEIGRPSSIVRWTLKQLGYAGVNDGDSDETGEAPKATIARQGIHILRRSGARALFDYLRDHAGYDGALQRVRVMLHHSTARMTEKYLDVTVENAQRDEAIRGKLLFPHIAKPKIESHDNVVNLDDKRAG